MNTGRNLIKFCERIFSNLNSTFFFFNPEICGFKCKSKINVAAALVQTGAGGGGGGEGEPPK